jgi:hypothetical protein
VGRKHPDPNQSYKDNHLDDNLHPS